MTAFVGEVHPKADIFPMLDEASLEALAADIKAHGLRDPLVIDRSGRLVDGRNRLAACRLAGVAPSYVTLPELKDEEAIAAYIASENLQRRDLTQGQKAHLAVRLCSESEQSVRRTAKVAGVGAATISEARVIAEYAPDLPALVIAGTLPHATAYDRAKAIKAGIERDTARRADLQQHAPDLLARIDDTFTVAMAHAALQERDKERIAEERRQAETRRNQLLALWGGIRALAGHDASAERRAFFDTLDFTGFPEPITGTEIDEAARVLARVKERL